MIGYVLKQDNMKTGVLFPTWKDLVERLEEMEKPKRHPATFGHALEIVYELMLKKGDEVVDGLPDAINTARKISDDLFNANANKERIVRCADCKYAGTNDCVLDVHVPFKPEGFCSWGDAR